MQLSKEQFEKGKTAGPIRLGVNRRDFLRAGVAVPAVGAFYFGYRRLDGSPVRAAIIGTGNEGCAAMIAQSSPDYIEYVAYHDIRPSQIARGRRELCKLYGDARGNQVRFYDDYNKLLADPNIEVVVIATPLWTHADLSIRAMEAGKDVLCEKLMAHNVADAKKMVRTAEKTGKILSIGHQRHYSSLYADAVANVHAGILGDIRCIRAFWHRNNTYVDPNSFKLHDSWKPEIPEEDRAIDPLRYGYKSLEELVRWRLYDRTGGGLMAELGSHQLDACSIFLNKAHPLSVTSLGGKHYFTDDRECEDHVYCVYEFPNNVTVTYSTINTNAMEGYGEAVEGTRGSMLVLRERDIILFNENDPLAAARAEYERAQNEQIDVKIEATKPGEATMYSAASLGLPAQAAATQSQAVSRGYTEELEHFAYCVRHRDPANKVRCDGRTALADAVMALATNVALRNGGRIEFKDAWFDPQSDETPESARA